MAQKSRLSFVEQKENKVKGIKIEQASVDGTIYQFKVPVAYEIEGEINKIVFLMNEKEKEIELEFEWDPFCVL